MKKNVFKKLPESVKIKRKTYKIDLVPMPGGDEKKPLDGLILFGDKIEIDQFLSDQEIESTIIHEIIHGIAYHYDLNLTEGMVVKLEKGLYNTLQRNGWKIICP